MFVQGRTFWRTAPHRTTCCAKLHQRFDLIENITSRCGGAYSAAATTLYIYKYIYMYMCICVCMYIKAINRCGQCVRAFVGAYVYANQHGSDGGRVYYDVCSDSVR